jgi:hypothetical protein
LCGREGARAEDNGQSYIFHDVLYLRER